MLFTEQNKVKTYSRYLVKILFCNLKSLHKSNRHIFATSVHHIYIIDNITLVRSVNRIVCLADRLRSFADYKLTTHAGDITHLHA